MYFDIRGKEINKEDYVRYVNTGTIGKILEFRVDEKKPFALIDKTKLWYSTNLLELLDPKDVKVNEWELERNQSVDVDSLEKIQDDFHGVTNDSDAIGGG